MTTSLSGTGVVFNDGSVQSTASALATNGMGSNLGTTGDSSRLINTTYTNGLGRPMVWVFSAPNDNGTWYVWIDGVVRRYINGYGTSSGATIVVPKNSTYKMERGGFANSTTWFEY